jgi:hypothetical protein
MGQGLANLEQIALGGLTEPSVSIGVWDWDLSSNIIYADEAVASAFGLTVATTSKGLPPDAYFSMIHEEDRQMVIDHSMRSIATNGSCSDNFRIVRADGTKWVHSQGRCFAGKDNAPRCFVGLITEIAPHERIEQRESYYFSGGAANDDVLYLCLHAKRIAMRSGRPFLTYLLEMVIAEVTESKVLNKC